MTIDDFLAANLVCPGSGDLLRKSGDGFAAGSVSYPMLDGIPWLFADPENARLEWARKVHSYFEREALYLKHLQIRMNDSGGSLANKRLSQQHQARSKNLTWMKSTLNEFKKPQDALALPSTQQIYSYFQLFFRDWCWGHEELTRYVEYCVEHIDAKTESILILGSGAGGLSYHLANHFTSTSVISAEHNPLLALGADKIFRGKSFKLTDYSVYPRDLNHASQTWEIKAEKLSSCNHAQILCEFPNMPFREKAFDVVIAPWFLDVVDFPFGDALDCASRMIGDEGKLLFFGPANVHKSLEHHQLCREEVEAEFTLRFSDCSLQQTSIPYLQSPLDSQQRMESVLFIDAKQPNQIASALTEKAFPRSSSPQKIRYTPEFERYKIENATFFHILSHVNQDMTYRELADVLEREFGFDPAESERYVELFIKRLELDIYTA
ncbi:MAG: hypothetical protein AAF434_14410 [Pseudomonadota bacterium]